MATLMSLCVVTIGVGEDAFSASVSLDVSTTGSGPSSPGTGGSSERGLASLDCPVAASVTRESKASSVFDADASCSVS